MKVKEIQKRLRSGKAIKYIIYNVYLKISKISSLILLRLNIEIQHCENANLFRIGFFFCVQRSVFYYEHGFSLLSIGLSV